MWNETTPFRVPQAGDNVTIPCEWTVMMDVVPARIAYF